VFKLSVQILTSDKLDGYCAAAIVARFLKMKVRNYSIVFFDFEKKNEIIENLLKEQKNTIIVLDIPFDEFAKKELFEALARNQNKLYYWNTHNKSSIESTEIIKKSCKHAQYDEHMCAAMQAQIFFQKRDRISRKLGEIAQDHEFWLQKKRTAKKLADLVASGYDKRKLIEEFSKGIIWTPDMNQLYQEYLEKKEHKLRTMLKNMTVKEYPVSIGYVQIGNISKSEAGHFLCVNGKLELIAMFSDDGKVAFRKKKDSTVDLSALALLFNGGGNINASGGRINMKEINKDNFEKAISTTHEKIEKFFEVANAKEITT